MNFSQGRAAVCFQKRCGYVDLNGKLVIPMSFLAVSPFSGGYAFVTLDGQRDGAITRTGAVLFRVKNADQVYYPDRGLFRVDRDCPGGTPGSTRSTVPCGTLCFDLKGRQVWPQ